MSTPNAFWSECEDLREKFSFLDIYSSQVDSRNLIPEELLAQLRREGIFSLKSIPLNKFICRIRSLSYYSPAIAHTVLVHATAWHSLQDKNDIEERENILALSITEPGGGTDIRSSLKTRAGAGDKTQVTGEKIFTSNAPYASYYVVLADSPRGPTLYLVKKCDLVEYEILDITGLRGTGASRVIYRGAPAERISDYGSGVKDALKGISLGRLGYGAIALGITERALNEIARIAMSKEIFGRKLADYQGLKWRIAGLYSRMVLLESAIELSVMSKEWRVDPLRASIIKNEGASLAQDAAWLAVQISGGRGLSRWSTTDRLARDSRALDIGEGAREVLLDYIGSKAYKHILK